MDHNLKVTINNLELFRNCDFFLVKLILRCLFLFLLSDQTHELIVYEIGDKVELLENPFYLQLPSDQKNKKQGSK